MGTRVEDLHLFSISIETLPCWSEVSHLYGISAILIFTFKELIPLNPSPQRERGPHYNSTCLILSTALSSFSMASNTSNTLSDQPAIK